MMQDVRDVLAAVAGDTGFETFEETVGGLNGYVQQTLFDKTALDEALTAFPFEDVNITYEVVEAEDQDWNAEWEAEGFEPIVVADGQLVVHDGRHLPATSHQSPVTIEIDARMAFGTGTHETTRLMLTALSTLLSPPSTLHFTPSTLHFTPSTVLDCGTGTGILAIAALKLGATKAVGYDIDEWSVDNARHNAVINQVDERFTPLLGDASVLDTIEETFDVVMANINRNILLNDMPRWVSHMHAGSRLLLSGFYEVDAQMLIEKAKELGLTLDGQFSDQEWTSLTFSLR